jgi:hypothetical protein
MKSCAFRDLRAEDIPHARRDENLRFLNEGMFAHGLSGQVVRNFKGLFYTPRRRVEDNARFGERAALNGLQLVLEEMMLDAVRRNV